MDHGHILTGGWRPEWMLALCVCSVWHRWIFRVLPRVGITSLSWSVCLFEGQTHENTLTTINSAKMSLSPSLSLFLVFVCLSLPLLPLPLRLCVCDEGMYACVSLCTISQYLHLRNTNRMSPFSISNSKGRISFPQNVTLGLREMCLLPPHFKLGRVLWGEVATVRASLTGRQAFYLLFWLRLCPVTLNDRLNSSDVYFTQVDLDWLLVNW